MAQRWMLWIAPVALLAGCATGPFTEEPADSRDQARQVLARYEKAVGGRAFVPVGGTTGQIGDWEPTNEGDKLALTSGRAIALTALPAAPQTPGTIVWAGGATLDTPLISAGEALKSVSAGGCPECPPLKVSGAELTTARIETTRGPATVPVWAYSIPGTAVRITQIAVAGTATITPPSWDPANPPESVNIDSAATTRGSSRLTLAFIGSPGPASRPCGMDYTAEAVESELAVVVIVTSRAHGTDEVCTAIGAQRTAPVELTKPLGDRAVLNLQAGLPVPVSATG